MSRKYHFIIGSKKYFDQKLLDINKGNKIHSNFLDLVKKSDDCKGSRETFKYKASILIIKNNNYSGITEQAHDRLGAIIEELTTDNAEIFIHNPPIGLKEYLKSLEENQKISLTTSEEKYILDRNGNDFCRTMKSIGDNIIGQNKAIIEIAKSIWYLKTTKRKKPYVIMLYGNSSLGKTELVREVAEKFYDSKYYEKHLSMFKNNAYSDYLFGEKPNRRTLAFDLLERESNLIFLDEIDKCSEHFYSAFYTLFDNTIFKDTSYEVDISEMLIILTSNYKDEKDMMKNLGLPLYYRIDKFVQFNDFDTTSIYNIVMKEIFAKEEEYQGFLTPEEIYEAVSPKILSSRENARTIKYKVQKNIEELLFQQIKDGFES